jgi:hypothetical protein
MGINTRQKVKLEIKNQNIRAEHGKVLSMGIKIVKFMLQEKSPQVKTRNPIF